MWVQIGNKKPLRSSILLLTSGFHPFLSIVSIMTLIPRAFTTSSSVKWDPDKENNFFFRQSSFLHTAFYWAQLQVHGLFIHVQPEQNNTPLRQPKAPSLAICTNAARCTVRIIDIQHHLRIQIPAFFMVGGSSSGSIAII